MAQFLNQKPMDVPEGMNAMGKPVSQSRRREADKHLQQMGVSIGAVRMATVEKVANLLENDRPYEARAAAMRTVDLIGSYRLFAVLLTASPEERQAIEK